MPSLTPNYNFKKPDWDTEAADIRVFNDNMDIADEELKKLEEDKQNKEDSTLKTIAKTIVGAINELFSDKLDKGGYTGTAKNLNDEIAKKASKTVLGRMIVGDNLTVDDNGRVSGNPAYTHPTGNGNSHIPVNGTSGNFLKWLSSGVAQWANITWSDITGKPSTFPPSSHTHDYAPKSHIHDDRYYTESEINTKLDNKEPKIVTKNSAFNKPFGTSSNTVLEGSKLAEILGLTYGGSLNTNSAKTVNYAYYDSTTKKVYKCIKATSINYADATYFTAISNNDLLGKLQNLPQDFKILYNGICNKITTLTLPNSWRELYILHSGDNDFTKYAFPFVVNRISLEVTKKITFYELWGGDSTDWGNLLYDVNLKTLKLASQNASDNLIVISYR